MLQHCQQIQSTTTYGIGHVSNCYRNSVSFRQISRPSVLHLQCGQSRIRGQDSNLQLLHASSAGVAAQAEPPAASVDGSILFAKIRALTFYLWTLLISVPLFITMLLQHPFVMLFDKFKRQAQHFVNNLWAKASTNPFYPIEISGWENLPGKDRSVVYVANHQSFMDIYSLFHLNRDFKFISKESNFLIPIIGWSMFMTGHVRLKRLDRRSQLACLGDCRTLLEKGASVLFFPEGTRSKDRVMRGFKKGAFSVAVKSKADVVPITLIGTGDVMPSGRESEMYWQKVKIVVHPPIPTAGRNADEVCNKARAAIASALPPELVGGAADFSDVTEG